MMRKCPYCKNTVSFWAVIKPGLWKDRKIKCNSCKEEISHYWEQVNIVAWIILGIVTVLFIELLDSVWYLELIYIFLFYVVLLILAYALVPLKKLSDG